MTSQDQNGGGGVLSTKMSKEQRERLLDALDRVCRRINGVGLDESLHSAHNIFSRLAEATERVNSQDKLEGCLADVEALSWPEERLVLTMCKYGPNLLRVAGQALAKAFVEDLPAPPGGRPRTLELKQQQEACKYVHKLLWDEVSLDHAVMRTAQKYAVSESTIRRLWSKRKQIAAGEADVGFEEALQFAAKLLSE